MSKANKTMTGQEFWKAVTSDPSEYNPKVKFRVSLPAGQNLKVLNLLDIKPLGDVDLSFQLPFFIGESGLGKLSKKLKDMGVSVELEDNNEGGSESVEEGAHGHSGEGESEGS